MLVHKRCVGPCGRDLEIDQFHWKSKRKGTRQARCKDCMSDYGHTHYLANSTQYKNRANTRLRALRAANRELMNSYYLTHSCVRCGETNPKVLGSSIDSNDTNNLATADLLAKLSLCRILCKNCEARMNSVS